MDSVDVNGFLLYEQAQTHRPVIKELGYSPRKVLQPFHSQLVYEPTNCLLMLEQMQHDLLTSSHVQYEVVAPDGPVE